VGTFDLKGKIISKHQLPLKDLKIEAYDDDALLNPDDFLGKTTTDSDGLFRIDFDESKFSGFLEGLEGTPDVYLIVKEKEEEDDEDHNAADDDAADNQAKQLLKTRTMKTKKEIEYHIRILDGDNNNNNNTIPNPNAIDIYSGNARRMISMLNEVGNLIGIENRINLDILNNGNPPEDIRNKLQNFVKEYEDRRNNFNHFTVILSTLVDSFLEEIRIGNIGYDGPQVPRQPRRKPYNQVIIWPRNEEFKWA
jgi:hypothetical protein